jgi:hypothetical protein
MEVLKEMKNIRISALLLCVLIMGNSSFTHGFSLSSITSSLHQTWKKIINNPIKTTCLIGGASLLVAALHMARKNRVALRWQFDENSWFGKLSYQYLDEKSDRPNSPRKRFFAQLNRDQRINHSKSPTPTSDQQNDLDTEAYMSDGEIIDGNITNDHLNLDIVLRGNNAKRSRIPLGAFLKATDSLPRSDSLSRSERRRSKSAGNSSTINSLASIDSFSDLPNTLGSLNSNSSIISKNPYVDSPVSSLNKQNIIRSVRPINDYRFNNGLFKRGLLANNNYSQNEWTGSLRSSKHLLKLQQNGNRSSIDLNNSKDPVYRIFTIDTIKELMKKYDESRLLKMELSNDLIQYPNLVKLVDDIKLVLFDNNLRMNDLKQIALENKALDLQDNLRSLVFTLRSYREKGYNPRNHAGLKAWLATLVKNPTALLSIVPSANQEQLTLLEHLYNAYDKNLREYHACISKLSDNKWLFDTERKSQKKRKLTSFLSRFKSESIPSSSNNK